MIVVFAFVIVVAAWSLLAGMRSSEMSAMGVPYGTFRRYKQPFGFWLSAAFNVMLLVGGVLLFIEEVRR